MIIKTYIKIKVKIKNYLKKKKKYLGTTTKKFSMSMLLLYYWIASPPIGEN